MDALLNHIDHVRENPTDKAAALALVDHLQESEGATRGSALRAVAKARRDARNAIELAAAARALSPAGKYRHSLARMARAFVGHAEAAGASIMPVCGSRPPRLTRPNRGANLVFWRAPAITVGARWVLRAEQMLALFDGLALERVTLVSEDGKF